MARVCALPPALKPWRRFLRAFEHTKLPRLAVNATRPIIGSPEGREQSAHAKLERSGCDVVDPNIDPSPAAQAPRGTGPTALLATLLLGLGFALLFLRWQTIDQAPPEWDEAMYLLDAMNEFDGARRGGMRGFYEAFLTTNPGRVGLLAVLAQPGFWLLAPSPDAAILPFAVLCLLAVWAFYDFTASAAHRLLGFDGRAAALAGFAAALFFALYPATQYQSNKFLAEFPLIASVAVLHAAALRFLVSGGLRWALAIGVAATAGLLAKVTFPALAFVPVVLVLLRWWRRAGWREAAGAALLMLVPPLVIVGPFLVRNIDAIVAQTRFLSSAQLADVYGFGGAMSLARALDWVLALLHQYEFAVINALALAALVLAAFARAGCRWCFVLALGYLVPLSIVAFSNFKIERYAYPGYVPLFCLAGLGLLAVCRGRPRVAAVLLACLALPPTIKAGVTYSLLPQGAEALVSWTNRSSWTSEKYDPVQAEPQPRPDLPTLVRDVDGHALPGTVLLLGGSPGFHGALLQLETRLQGRDRTYTTFSPIEVSGVSGLHRLMTFIRSLAPAAILYKTPPYTPEFLGKLVPEVVSALSESGEYRRLDLKVRQPDGSRFALFLPAAAGGAIVGDARAPFVSQFQFGASYDAAAPEFTEAARNLAVTIAFHRTGPPVRAEAVFFHVLDEAGNTIANLDRPVCQGCANTAKVASWAERFVIPSDLRDRARRIAFGVYTPTPPAEIVEARGGETDWGGRRILVSLPEVIKPAEARPCDPGTAGPNRPTSVIPGLPEGSISTCPGAGHPN